jgi:hypothetical protein
VSSWSNRNEAWAEVVRGIRAAIGAATPAIAPVPAYESPEIRAVAEDLERARLRRRALVEAGASTRAIDGEAWALGRGRERLATLGVFYAAREARGSQVTSIFVH